MIVTLKNTRLLWFYIFEKKYEVNEERGRSQEMALNHTCFKRCLLNSFGFLLQNIFCKPNAIAGSIIAAVKASKTEFTETA